MYYNFKSNPIEVLKGKISDVFFDLFECQVNNFTLEIPADLSFGDLACNIAMTNAKILKQSPIVIASRIVESLSNHPLISKISVAKPGFINISCSPEFFANGVENVALNDRYGFCDYGNNEKLNIEYVSANPTGPVHVGHARGAILGDCIAQLFDLCGYDVCREYYINDAGKQIDSLANSLWARYKELLGSEFDADSLEYQGSYLIDCAKALSDKHGKGLNSSSEEDRQLVRNFGLSYMMDMIKGNLDRLDIKHDTFTSEKDIRASGLIEECLAILESKDLLYEGKLPEPLGKKPDDWEQKTLTLFKSSNFGDSEDRVVKREDGSYTYFVPDIAYSQEKLARGYQKMILILGCDHVGSVPRIKHASIHGSKTPDLINWEAIMYQSVKYVKNGEPVKMSKRAGNFESISDVLDLVPKDVLRFMMLWKKSEIPIEFDLQKALEETKDNPLFYIQYASARINSILRNNPIDESQIDLSLLEMEAEKHLILKMLLFPYVVSTSLTNKEIHNITGYLYDLATLFHSYWHEGNSDGDKRIFVSSNKALSNTRAKLCAEILKVISLGLSILKIEPVKKM